MTFNLDRSGATATKSQSFEEAVQICAVAARIAVHFALENRLATRADIADDAMRAAVIVFAIEAATGSARRRCMIRLRGICSAYGASVRVAKAPAMLALVFRRKGRCRAPAAYVVA